MDRERKEQLLAYASVCFEHMTSPFETMHLVKMDVTLDECGDLSEVIADCLRLEVSEYAISKAEEEFKETQI